MNIEKERNMKKIAHALTVFILCFGLAACDGDKKSSDNQQYREEVSLALAELKREWTEIYKKSIESEIIVDGYLEINNTRVISMRPTAAAKLKYDDLRYIVEFTIFTDYFGSSPYYVITEYYNTIAISNDGKAQVMERNLIRDYQQRTFQYDFPGFIESIHDFNDEYNISMKLLKNP